MKPIHLIAVISTCSIVCSLESCVVSDPYYVDPGIQKQSRYYAPSTSNAPLLSKKHDASLNLLLSIGKHHSSTDVGGAYMAGKHVGFIFNYSSGKGPYGYGPDYHRTEIGSGYTTMLDSSWQVETYAGFGTGSIHNNHYTGTSNVRQSNIFIQPAIAWKNMNGKAQFGIVSKFSLTHFNVLDTSFNTDREQISAAQLKSLYEKPNHIFWEPGLIFRFGWKNILIHTGYSWCTDLTDHNLLTVQEKFTIGIQMRFNIKNDFAKSNKY